MKEQYAISKTLRFELKPIGATLENIIIDKDKGRADSYAEVKKLIDEYHKSYIDDMLKGIKFTEQELKDCLGDEKAAKMLCKRIGNCFHFDGGELLNKKDKLLLKYLQDNCLDNEENVDRVKEFDNFATYFVSFNKIRENIYSPEGKAGSVAYRIIYDNLPRFKWNCENLVKITESGICIPSDLFCLSHFNECLGQSEIEAYNKTIGEYNSRINEFGQKNGLKLKPFKVLYKQILSDRANNALYESFETKEQLVQAVKDFCQECKTVLDGTVDIDQSGASINKDKLATISHRVFGNWEYLGGLLNKQTKKQDKFEFQYLLGLVDDEGKDKLCKELNSIKQLRADAVGAMKNITYENIKTVLDAIKRVQEHMHIFNIETDYEIIEKVIALYNRARNFVTKKPYREEKIKLNFDNYNLLGGWDENKIVDSSGVILRKDGLYYVGIVDKKHNKLFKGVPTCQSGECYEKMVYKLIPGAAKMIAKCAFPSKSIPRKYLDGISDDNYEEIKEIYEDYTYKKERDPKHQYGEQDLKKITDFLKIFLPRYYSYITEWNFKNKYESYREFIEDVERVGYNVSFTPVASSFIDDAVREGKLYLFQIYSKDFSSYSKGMPNLHTLYFKSLFCAENLKSRTHKLSGGAEIFWRPKSLPYKVTHKAGEPTQSKRLETKGKMNTPKYDLVKDKRFTEDKFFFHVPIELNRGCNNERISPVVNDIVQKQGKKVNVIGIDRGERHLLYLVLIDGSGKIIMQKSLNEIVSVYNDREFKTDYNALLADREGEQKKARQDWTEIGNIKDLKHGYMSQVIPYIVNMAIENNAVIAIENLNMGFKNSRIKVGKSVYQNFEKALIDKLNYVVSKDRDEKCAIGGLQLANKFESFEKLKGQSGILFYVDPKYTSKIDPTTGYIPTVNLSFVNIDLARKLIAGFKDFRFNDKKDYFEITTKDYTICTHGIRVANVKDGKDFKSEKINVTQELKDLFVKNNIDINGNLKQQLQTVQGADFYKTLLWLLKIAFGVRNSYTGTTEDYILSPVMNKHGKFFDTREYAKMKDPTMPTNADANGAYNIAMKGLMGLRQIQEYGDRKFDKGKELEKWLEFVRKCN